MIGQISASNQLRTSSEHVRSYLRTSSELAANMFGASSELVSVIEFGFYCLRLPATSTFVQTDCIMYCQSIPTNCQAILHKDEFRWMGNSFLHTSPAISLTYCRFFFFIPLFPSFF